MAGRYGLVTRVAIRAPLVLSVCRPVLCRPTGLQHEHALRVMALRAVTKNPYYQQRDMLVTVSQFTGLGGWESKILIVAVSPIRNPTIYESFESPHPLRLYTQRLVTPTAQPATPPGLLCFGNCRRQVASPNPSRASARVTLIACTAFRRRSHRPADQNTAVIIS